MTSPSDASDSGDGESVLESHKAAVVCVRCGTRSEGPPATWTCSVEKDEYRYLCEPCTRGTLRAIEGRLNTA